MAAINHKGDSGAASNIGEKFRNARRALNVIGNTSKTPQNYELDDFDKEDEEIVPPALAKQIIQKCLLPLFERKGMPIIRQSNKKQGATAQSDGKNLGFLNELRLSDQLLADLDKTRQESFDLLEKLDRSQNTQESLMSELGRLRAAISNIHLELKMSRFQESNVRMKSQTIENRIQGLRTELEDQMKILILQKDENFRLSSRLFEEEAKVEHLSQVVAQNQNASSLCKLTNDVLAEQVKNLHGAVESLSDIDKLKSELAADLQQFANLYRDQHNYKEEIEVSLACVVDERNHYDNVRRDLATSQEWLMLEQTRLTNELEEQKQRSQSEVLSLYEEKENLRKERDKIEKKLRDVSENRDKLKQKMKKYRARRKMFEAERKRCKKCGKEYNETDNFNWSCRTHQCDFGGEMWWCCGKLGKDAIGCKFAKHESKDDDDDLDEQERKEKEENEGGLKTLNVRCYSCRELGHYSKDCTRDPNVRTGYNPDKELMRVSQLNLASRKLVRLMDATEVGNLVNEKLGYKVLGHSHEHTAGPYQTPFADLLKISTGKKTESKMKDPTTVEESEEDGSEMFGSYSEEEEDDLSEEDLEEGEESGSQALSYDEDDGEEEDQEVITVSQAPSESVETK